MSAASKMDEEDKHQLFDSLVAHVVEKYKNVAPESVMMTLPDSIEEIVAKFNTIRPNVKEAEFVEPQSIEEIQFHVVHTLIISSLCTASDKSSYAFHLFKIYQQYPDSLLRRVMEQLRQQKMVSIKKNYNKARIRRAEYLPLSSSPYQLSVTFAHIFLQRYRHETYHQSWQVLRQLMLSYGQTEGYDLLSSVESGAAALTCGLMSQDRLQFQTSVPEQLIVLDPKVPLVDKQYANVLQRYQDLLRNAGVTDDDDEDVNDRKESNLKMANTSDRVTVSDLFKKPTTAAKSSPGKKRPATSPLVTTPAKSSRIESAKSSDTVTFLEAVPDQPVSVERGSCSQLAKSASRIALYMLREDVRAEEGEGILSQHSHDFFVIASCTIKAWLKSPEDHLGPKVKVSLDKVSTDLMLPQSVVLSSTLEATKVILSRFGLDSRGRPNNTVEKLKRVFIPKDIPAIDELSGSNSKTDKANLKMISDLINSGKERGVNGSQILDLKLRPSEKDHVTYTNLLLTHWIVIRTGVTEARYIGAQFLSPWTLHSFKLSKGTNSLISSAPKFQDTEQGQEVHLSHRKKMVRSTEDMSGGNQLAEASAKVNWDQVQEVDFLLRPWMKIDGSLNRRVLDRLLGSILAYIMQRPGLSLAEVGNHFSPALLPFYTRELIEILEELGCVQLQTLVKIGDEGLLFGAPQQLRLQPASKLDEAAAIVVEAVADAIVRLGTFIGDKQYQMDFVGHCSCHPDRN